MAVEHELSSYDSAGAEAYLSKMPGATFVQPPPLPQPPGYWTAPCDNGCYRGTKYNYDMHGQYEVYCSKCEDGVITAKSLAYWLRRQEGPDYS